MKKEGRMKSKTLERLLAETSEATKQEVSAYADKIVQLRKEAEAAWEGDNPPDNWVNGYIVGALANQIQLPTDEEIKEEADSYHGLESYNITFVQGAKWMRDKIKGGNNE